jgi:hypothetical protein
MKFPSKKVTFNYFYNQLTGNFLGFIVGMSATGLVSQFFEKRSIKNLWGITSRKAVVDKDTFAALEWCVSILIGFIVFEMVTKGLKLWLEQRGPAIKRNFFRFLIARGLHLRWFQARDQIRRVALPVIDGAATRIRRITS